MAEPRHQHRPRLHAAAPRPARRGGAPRPARHGRAALVAARRVSRRSVAAARRSAARSSAQVARARRSSGGADVRARQRDSAGRRPLARPRCASSGSCATCTTDAKAASPDSLFTYVNFPPTEFLDLSFFDICAFNVYLHREAGAARLPRAAAAHRRPQAAAARRSGRRQHPRGRRRAGRRSPRCTSAPPSRKARAARSRSPGPTNGGAAAITVDDWAFGLVDRERRPKPAARAVAAAFADAPFPRERAARRGRACRSSSAPTTPPTRSRTACRRSSG